MILLLVVMFTNFPMFLIERGINWSGNHAEGLTLSSPAADLKRLSINRLHIIDENKTLEISNLSITVPLFNWQQLGQGGVTLQADRIAFVDETKPNKSLYSVLQSLPASKAENGEEFCLKEIRIGELSVAISHSAEPFEVRDLQAVMICFGNEVSYEKLDFKSAQVTQLNSGIEVSVNSRQFYDVKTELRLLFPRKENQLQLQISNMDSLLRELSVE